jgi:hypothetical protein
MAACSNGSTDIDLDHDDIGLVLVAVLDAPPAQLIVAYSCPNFDQVLPHLLFLLDRVDFSHFPDEAEMLDALLGHDFFNFSHLHRPVFHNSGSSLCHFVRVEGDEQLFRI